MFRRRDSFFIAFAICFFSFVCWAEFKVPRLQGPVMDQGNMFSTRIERSLDKLIRKIHRQGGPQLQILSVNSLDGEPIEGVSIHVMDQWKIGDKDRDNGILLLFAKQERKMRIEVGQGLEGDLPDAYAKRIIDYKILPYFKKNQFDRGLANGVVGIYEYTAKDLLKNNLNTRSLPKRTRKPDSRELIEYIIMLIALIVIVVFKGFLGIGRGGYGGRGGFGGGGFGGGGWSGGGGGFSGGGASGGW